MRNRKGKQFNREKGTFSKRNRAEPGSLERFQYFESLLNELQETDLEEYKLQVCIFIKSLKF